MRRDTKELIGCVLFAVLNIIIAYLITTPLNIKDVVLFQSYTATNYTITYEILIWFILGLTEAYIYEKKIKKDETV